MLAFAQAVSLLSGLPLQAGGFLIESDGGRLTSIRYSGDKTPTNYVAADAKLGDLNLTFRKSRGAWQSASTRSLDSPAGKLDDSLDVSSKFEQTGPRLLWRMRVKNVTNDPIELGGLATPLPMRTRFDRSSKSSV